jgi:transcriptional regulator with PAS, ATPase and Fis domain
LEVEDFTMVAEDQPSSIEGENLPGVGRMTIDEMEKRMIIKSLKHHDYNISKVADSLGLSRAARYPRMEK